MSDPYLDIADLPEPRKFQGHILVAEDNRLNQMLIGIYLDKVGLTYDLANNGLEALTLAETTGYDLILMDIMMPVMDGLCAAKEIRSIWADGQETPIIALSANDDSAHLKEYQDAGMRGLIAKPIRADHFYRAIAALLEERRAAYQQAG